MSTPVSLAKRRDQENTKLPRGNAFLPLRSELHGASTVSRFLTSGRAVVTLQSEATGNHLTFRFSRRRGSEVDFGLYFKGDKWQYLGILQLPNWTLSLRHPGTIPSRALVFLISSLRRKGIIPPKLHIFHEGTCGRCGRALTHPESLAIGLGPDCAGRR